MNIEMKSEIKNKIAERIKKMGNVGKLSTEELIEISRDLFYWVSFCECKLDKSDDVILHQCNRFYHHDYRHISCCKCCQKTMLLYCLGRGMEKLAADGRLSSFDEAHLSHARIQSRTYDHTRFNSELIFRISRHPNAWRNEANMNLVTQTWVFDFRDLSLKELSYDASTIGISIRKLMESRSEWKETTTQLLAELKKAAERIKIDTKSSTWPSSPYRLNQILRELNEYLEDFGIYIEKHRYIKIGRTRISIPMAHGHLY